MGTRATSRPAGPHLFLGLGLMIAALTLQHAQAEITCGRCPSPVKLRLQKLEKETRATEPDTRVEFIGASVEDAVSSDEDGTKAEGESVGEKEDAELRRTRRSASLEFGELGKWSGRGLALDSGDALEGHERVSMLDGQKQRPVPGWSSRDPGRGRGNPRQDEPRLSSSSTFALTGDSAHNHAVVYWAGQNSSVSTRPSDH